jgi:hypothetical protein
MVVIVLVFAAFDDITTDNATSFPVEYTLVAIAGLWFLFVSVRLLLLHQRVLGTISLVDLCVAARALPGLRPSVTAGLWSQYIVTLVAYLWFVGLSIAFLWRDRQETGEPQHHTA